MAETEIEDKWDRWEEGHRAAARSLLRIGMEMLGGSSRDDDLVRLTQLAVERDETRAVLRRLCASHGDNDWNDRLRLPDALEKHLGNYLGDRSSGERHA
jgi:hypothetical protein